MRTQGLGAAVVVCLAGLGPGPAGGLKLEALQEPRPLRRLHDDLEMAGKDYFKQQVGCEELWKIAEQSTGSKLTINGYPEVFEDMIKSGLGEEMSKALLRILESDGPEDKLLEAASVCYHAILSIQVGYDHERGVLLLKYAPHLMRAVVGFMRRFKQNRDVVTQAFMLSALFGDTTPEATPFFAEAGGFDLVFEVLENNSSDMEIAWANWAALSDHADASKAGAQLIANHGGQGQGIQFIVQALRAAHGKHYMWPMVPGERRGLQYEIVHTANGLLLNDDQSNSSLKAFVQAGFMDEVLETMRDEPDEQNTLDNCCQAITYMAEGNVLDMTAPEKVKDGILNLLVAAIKAFPKPGAGDGYLYTTLNSCAAAMLGLADGRPEVQDKLLALGVPELLASGTALHENWQIYKPWAKRFSKEKVGKLRKLLDDRHSANLKTQ